MLITLYNLSRHYSAILFVIELICYRTRVKRPINEINTIGWLETIWTGIRANKAPEQIPINLDIGKGCHFWYSLLHADTTNLPQKCPSS